MPDFACNTASAASGTPGGKGDRISRRRNVSGVRDASAGRGKILAQAFSQSCPEDDSKAEEAVHGGEYAADLRFGHDFPLMDLCCHLGIEGYDVSYNCGNLDASWQGFMMMPMASNVQMILYRNAGNDILVKFLFQEREVKIAGLSPVSGPYYRWTDVKGKLE